MKKNTRYYLHGDRSEESPELYFCKQCDVFFKADHFQGQCRCKDHQEKYRSHLKAFKASVKSGSDATRPENADNLFT